MSSRVLLFGAVLIALITAKGRAQASTNRSCSMLSRVDRVTRGLGMQLQVDLFVVETSDNDPTMCLPRGPSTKVAAEAVDFATVTRVRVGSWVWFTHSHDISHPNPEGLTQSTRTRRLSIAPPSDAARGELLAKQPPVEPAGSAHAVFKAWRARGRPCPGAPPAIRIQRRPG